MGEDWLVNVCSASKLAHVTHTPEGFLHRLPIPDFRTLVDPSAKRPSPDLLDTVQMMQRRQTWMSDSLIEEAESPLKFVGSATLKSNVQRVAAEMRKTLGVPDGWAKQESTWTDKAAKFIGVQFSVVVISDDSQHVVVTHEELIPDAKKRIPLPNVCKPFGVDYVDPFTMLKDLKVQFNWRASDS